MHYFDHSHFCQLIVLFKRLFLAAILASSSLAVFADNEPADQEIPLDESLQQLKKEVLSLNRDLYVLKEELLFPANSQVAVFLSLDVGRFFSLDAVSVEIDGKEIANYLYTEKQVDALVRGGVHRLFMGNVRNGEHEIVAVFTGKDPEGRDFRRAASLVFEKTAEPKYLELAINDSTKTLQTDFVINEWE